MVIISLSDRGHWPSSHAAFYGHCRLAVSNHKVSDGPVLDRDYIGANFRPTMIVYCIDATGELGDARRLNASLIRGIK